MTISEPELGDVTSEHVFELRSTGDGAEVWRSSTLRAPGGECASEPRFVGWLSARRVIDLLDEIQRSGIYEALPAFGLAGGDTRIDSDSTSAASPESDRVNADQPSTNYEPPQRREWMIAPADGPTDSVPGIPADTVLRPGPDAQQRISMEVSSSDHRHELLDHAPVESAVVGDLLATVRRAIEQAQERALSASG